MSDEIIRVKIVSDSENNYSLKVIDMETGKILPVLRSVIDLRVDGKVIIAQVELLITEVDVIAVQK